MEEVSCALCGMSQTSVFRRGRDRLHGGNGVFTLVRCLGCGLVYLNPRPREMEAYYPPDYPPFTQMARAGEPPWRRWDRRYGLARRRRLLEGWKQKGKLLDVGCATGAFLEEMRRAGWQVVGVEPNPWASAYARERLGLGVFTGTLEEAHLPAAAFDAVTFWDTFEHLPNPSATLEKVRRILKEEGVLLLNLPNLDSWDAHLFGDCWAGLDLPRHLYVYSQETLATLLERAGFEVVRTLYFTGRYHSFALSLQFLLGARGEWARALLALAHSPLARALSYPYFVLLDRLGRGSTLTVLAQKRN